MHIFKILTRDIRKNSNTLVLALRTFFMSGPIQLRRNYLKHCTNNKIEDPSDMVAATMKNLAPLIIIFQYYQAYKPLIVRWGGPPDL